MINKSFTYGVLTGLIVVIYTVLLYSMGMEYYASWWLAILAFVIIVFLVFFFGVKVKKAFPDEIFDFKKAFTTLLIIGTVGSLVTVIWNVLLFNVIDTGLAKELTEHVIEQTSTMMENFGAPEAQIDEALTQMADMPDQFKTGPLITGWLKGCIFYVILSAIGALIIRHKENKDVSAL